MKCILIDDEQKAREMLRILLEKNFPEIEIVGETSNIPEGVKLIHRLHPDVVFLDIEMPIYSGLEILDFFDKEHIHFKIIFVTAYAEHALKAFRLAAVDYLLKPIQLSQLSEAVTKLEKNETVSVQQLDALQHNLSGGKAERIALSLSEGLTIVELKDILYLKAEGSYTNVVLSGGKKILISKVLGEFAFLTEHHSFFRTNRSFIINIEKVKRIGRNGNEVILEGEIDIPVTPERKSDLLDLFKNIRI